MKIYADVLEAVRDTIPMGVNEVKLNESLGRGLRKRGFQCDVFSKGVDIVGDNYIIEGKRTLVERNHTLPKLKQQIDDYVGKYGISVLVVVVIYGDAKESLVREFIQYCFDRHFLTPEFIVKGRLLRGV